MKFEKIFEMVREGKPVYAVLGFMFRFYPAEIYPFSFNSMLPGHEVEINFVNPFTKENDQILESDVFPDFESAAIAAHKRQESHGCVVVSQREYNELKMTKELHEREEKIMKVMLEPGAFMPERAHEEDAGLDLRTPREVTIHPVLPRKETENSYGYTMSKECGVAIDTGVHVQIPRGYFGKIETKSGLNRKNHIVCCGGVIDEGYTGSIVVMVYNFGNEVFTFKEGDKIAQLIIQPCEKPELELVGSFETTERGDNGFGSTGR